MKTYVKVIIGIALVLLIEVIAAVFAFRHFVPRNMNQGIRDARYSIQMNRPGMARGMDRNAPFQGRRGMNSGIGTGKGSGMRPGMVPGQGFGMRPGMVPGQGFGMRRGMGPGPIDSLGLEMRGDGRLFGNILNLTEKQKKDITDLRQKQMGEMKNLRESQRSKILELLTPEQKNFLDSAPGGTNK